jgi:NAD(P)-dependent dehydrogenase (short-subunit alcohol dehydrogenase family)
MRASSLAAANRVVLVTGSTDGIGLTTAKNLAAKGFDVLIHGRDTQRIQQAREAVESFVHHNSNEDARVFSLPPVDLSTVEGGVRLASEVDELCTKEDLQLSVIMNNAGVYAEDHVVTEEGLELTFAVNVLAPFVITSLLLPRLLKQKRSRIVIASSLSQCQSVRNWDDLHYNTRRYSSHAAYSESKLLDAMLTMEFAKRLKDQGLGTEKITCNCLDPGTVNTKMLLAGWGPCGIDVADALDETWLCSSPEVDDVTGKYFTWQSERRASSSAYDEKERSRMWSMLSELAPEAAAMWKFDR